MPAHAHGQVVADDRAVIVGQAGGGDGRQWRVEHGVAGLVEVVGDGGGGGDFELEIGREILIGGDVAIDGGEGAGDVEDDRAGESNVGVAPGKVVDVVDA